MSILDKIAAYKREEIALAETQTPRSVLEKKILESSPPRGFRARLQKQRSKGEFGLIAEIKKASPSKGVIRADFNPVALACAYREGGATCLSVLTDKPSFEGSLDYLKAVRSAVDMPLLRKDFLLNPYQVSEARAFGADCILVVLAMVNDQIARDLVRTAREYGMDSLVEIHDQSDLDRALDLGADMIGINNRDLKTFNVDLGTTLNLVPQIPKDVLIVAESGLAARADLERLADAGVTTFLIGESLMRQSDVAAATRALIGAKVGS